MFNAEGKFAPPLLLFPYVRLPRAVIVDMPSGWVLGKSERGWMTSDVFFEFINNDIKMVDYRKYSEACLWMGINPISL